MERRLKIYMAPMQGITEAPFRNLFDRYFGGVETYYTPFVRWEHDGIRRKDLRDVSPENNHVPMLVPQILAGSLDEAEQLLAQILPLGYRRIDLNMGCAFPAVARKAKGCGILPFPEKVGDVLRVVERHPDVSFSVKMRLGYEEPDECLAVLPVLNVVKLACVTVHARTGKQQYKGECDLAAFARFAVFPASAYVTVAYFAYGDNGKSVAAAYRIAHDVVGVDCLFQTIQGSLYDTFEFFFKLHVEFSLCFLSILLRAVLRSGGWKF